MRYVHEFIASLLKTRTLAPCIMSTLVPVTASDALIGTIHCVFEQIDSLVETVSYSPVTGSIDPIPASPPEALKQPESDDELGFRAAINTGLVRIHLGPARDTPSYKIAGMLTRISAMPSPFISYVTEVADPAPERSTV